MMQLQFSAIWWWCHIMKQLTIMEINELWSGEHINYHYSPIIGKLIYPCAINPLYDTDDKIHKNICFANVFKNRSRYEMIR